eukprot:CAMPEP_0206435526 /NCGR_PEP_ID=MMETSP0324_2-20121206/9923_1 /ASSEMBLY_ACC=CAM_ASM_000836 /TAXON_ID=2866 /ORGANISM="Crypthecodinium cohnii, Strain Seligo" /LENGTH=214 /DNA_ID=CAMNT_0053902483 /DNA_START=42 /DNA_END=686 /DNA_ORIENTATION=+
MPKRKKTRSGAHDGEARLEGPPDVSQAEINQVLTSKSTLPAAFNSSKITIELLENSTTMMVRRLGWFRDVRLRRAADAFLKSHKLFQQASAKLDSDAGFEKPTHEQLQAFEQELKQSIEQLQQKMKVVPMNEAREIKVLSTQQLAAAAREKVAEAKKRAAELEKKPQSVKKTSALKGKKKRALGAKGGSVKKGKAAAAAAGAANTSANADMEEL